MPFCPELQELCTTDHSRITNAPPPLLLILDESHKRVKAKVPSHKERFNLSPGKGPPKMLWTAMRSRDTLRTCNSHNLFRACYERVSYLASDFKSCSPIYSFLGVSSL